jgi:hypothetical protein
MGMLNETDIRKLYIEFQQKNINQIGLWNWQEERDAFGKFCFEKAELKGYKNGFEDGKLNEQAIKRDLLADHYQAGKKEAFAEVAKSHFQKNNHQIGCELEAYTNILFYRGLKKEHDMLLELASRLK